jgi:hypothetical protein
MFNGKQIVSLGLFQSLTMVVKAMMAMMATATALKIWLASARAAQYSIFLPTLFNS